MMRTITVGSGPFQGATNQALQCAVDEVAAAGGGVVEVPAGTYRMRDSLHLRTGVRLLGEPGTVLLKEPSISVPLLDYLGYGHYELTVTEPDRLEVGRGITITDDDADGFYRTVATITGRRGDLLFIDRMLNHDYRPARNGRATTVFPIVSGRAVQDAAVENLTVDGNVAERTRMDGCRGAGVYLILSQRVRIEGVEVRHFNGDAVSFQQCADVTVRGCHLHENAGGGLHPGSGSVRYLLQENHVHDNGGCGVYYCLRTTHSICEGNRLEGNAQAGISVGERDTDHLIRDNTVISNRGPAILFRRPTAHGGDRVIIEANRFAENDQGTGRAEDRAEIRIPAGLEDVHVLRNTFEPAGGTALRVEPGTRGLSFSGNTVDRRPQKAEDVAGEITAIWTATPSALPPVGPAALPLDGARHLGFGDLPARKP